MIAPLWRVHPCKFAIRQRPPSAQPRVYNDMATWWSFKNGVKCYRLQQVHPSASCGQITRYSTSELGIPCSG